MHNILYAISDMAQLVSALTSLSLVCWF